MSNYVSTAPCPVPEHERLIMYGSKLLGVPRIRQLRVRNDSCTIPTAFKKMIKVCFGSFCRDTPIDSIILPWVKAELLCSALSKLIIGLFNPKLII